MPRFLIFLILLCFGGNLTLSAQRDKGSKTAPSRSEQPSATQRSQGSGTPSRAQGLNADKPRRTAPSSRQTNPSAAERSETRTSTRTQATPNVTENRTGSDTRQDGVSTGRSYGGSNPRKSNTTVDNTYSKKGTTAKSGGKETKKAEVQEMGKVNWVSIEYALEKAKVDKKKIFIDVYTDYCSWCRHLDSTTFTNLAVTKYINENFYAVKFNAEQHSDITYKDKTYKFVKGGARGFHQLAALWLNNRLTFPSVIFLDENQNLIQALPGYMDTPKMQAITHYFGTNSHKKTPWEAYQKQFVAEK